MSATTKSSETTRRGNESSGGPGPAASARNGADHSQDAAQAAVTEVVETATAISSKVVEQSREALMTGVRTAADISSRVADINFGRGQDLLSSAAHMMDIYRDASEQSAERIQTLFSSWMAMGRGFQQMQQAWLGMLDSSARNTTHKPQDILRCKTLVEVAEVQRELYINAINQTLESSSRMFELMNHTAQDAARPLQNHHH